MRGNLISGIAGGVCVAVLMCLFGAGRTDTVAARELVLVNAQGKTVGQIGSDATGEPFLQFKDSEGNICMRFDMSQKPGMTSKQATLKLLNRDSTSTTELDPTTLKGLKDMLFSPPRIAYQTAPQRRGDDAEFPPARILLLNHSKK